MEQSGYGHDRRVSTQSTKSAGGVIGTSVKLTPSEKLERIMFELLETERCYVEDLLALNSGYLIPLYEGNTLTIPHLRDVISCLIENVSTIYRFQKNFLEELEEAVGQDFVKTKFYSSPSQLRNALLHLGGVFINHSSRFKHYCSFCATHFKLQKILNQEENCSMLQQFLNSRNVQKQHSATLESFLIKPVQRVLRYPLFLQQMKSLTNERSPEHLQMSEALQKMERVAEYINEMQRIYEEHGGSFTALQSTSNDPTVSLDLSTLIMWGEIEWLNSVDEAVASSSENRSRRKQSCQNQPYLMFVFSSAIVLLGSERSAPSSGRRSGQKEKAYDQSMTVQRLIPMREVEVNGSDLGSSTNHHIWILIHLDHSLRVERIYHFATRHAEEKQKFLRAIRKAGLSLSRDPSSPQHISVPSSSPGSSTGDGQSITPPTRRSSTQSNVFTAAVPAAVSSLCSRLPTCSDSISIVRSSSDKIDRCPSASVSSFSRTSQAAEPSACRSCNASVVATDGACDQHCLTVQLMNNNIQDFRSHEKHTHYSISQNGGLAISTQLTIAEGTPSPNSTCGSSTHTSNPNQSRRPGSYHSSQSDAGYASNGEIVAIHTHSRR